jgi:hypothetical protein
VQVFVETHLAGGRIMMIDQRPRIIEDHLLRDPAEVPERLLARRRLSKRRQARASARNAWRRGATARSTVRSDTLIACSRRRSWRTTSQLPRCRRKPSASYSSSPSRRRRRRGWRIATQPPAAS